MTTSTREALEAKGFGPGFSRAAGVERSRQAVGPEIELVGRVRRLLDGPGTRENKIKMARGLGVFNLLRDDYNARYGETQGYMDETGDIARPAMIAGPDGEETPFADTEAGRRAYSDEIDYMRQKGRGDAAERHAAALAAARGRPSKLDAGEVGMVEAFRENMSPGEADALAYYEASQAKDERTRRLSDQEAWFRATGREYYRDRATGELVGQVNEDGTPRYKPEKKRKVAGGWFEDRDHTGKVSRYRAPLVFDEAGQAFYEYGPGDREPAGHVWDLARNEDPEVRKAAKDEMQKRIGQVRRAAAQPAWNAVNQATLELEGARVELGEIPKRMADLDGRLVEAEKAGQVEYGSGGAMGKLRGEPREWRAKTPEGQALLDELAALKDREKALQIATREDFRGGVSGELVRRREAALSATKAARETLRGGSIDAMIENRREWLEKRGADVEGDEVLAELEKAGRALGLRKQAVDRLPNGPREFYDGPRGWEEVDQPELDAGPKAKSEPEAEQPADDLGRIMKHQGLDVPRIAAGQSVEGRTLTRAEAERLNRELPGMLRKVFRGETLQTLSRYEGERAAGLWSNGLRYATNRVMQQKP